MIHLQPCLKDIVSLLSYVTEHSILSEHLQLPVFFGTTYAFRCFLTIAI